MKFLYKPKILSKITQSHVTENSTYLVAILVNNMMKINKNEYQ